MVIEKGRFPRLEGTINAIKARVGRVRRESQPLTDRVDTITPLRVLEPLPEGYDKRGIIPTESLSTADNRPDTAGERRERPSLQYVSRAQKPSQSQEHKPRGLEKFYLALKDRREHPQNGVAFAFDLGVETLGVPLIAIPGMQWMLALIPFIPWIETYTTGDALNLFEAAFGRTLGGKKLTLPERALYIAGALTPIVPGRLLVTGWEKLEDALVYPVLDHIYGGKHSK